MTAEPTPARRRICLISHEVIGERVAGPGIRYLELARVLAEAFDLILATPNDANLPNEPFEIHTYQHGLWRSLKRALDGAEVLVASGFSIYEFPPLQTLNIPIALDIYDPFPLESYHTFDSDEGKLSAYRNSHNVLEALTAHGDFFLCANERQRDWWLGVLQTAGRVNPATLSDDPTLRTLIDEMPYGFPSHPFARQGLGPRDLPHIGAEDELILWGGGLWNWLDPLTLIEAMPLILQARPNTKLLFPGTRHPNPTVPPMSRTQEAFDLARALDLRDTHIFFEEWVPYESWPAYLADADVAVSLHYNTLETRFAAVRSRVLSYIWAKIPIVATEGDIASHLIEAHRLGVVVPEQGVAEVAEAILSVLERGKANYAPNFDELAERYTWHRVAEPLIHFCQQPRRAADKRTAWPQHLEAARHPTAPERQSQLTQLLEQNAQQGQELAQLRTLVEGYESGRFIRLMRHIGDWRTTLFGAEGR